MIEDVQAAYGHLPFQFGMILHDHVLKAWHRAVDDIRCDLEEARPGYVSRIPGIVYPAAAALMLKRHPDLATDR